MLLGFPVALVLAWAFEVTPEGVRKDSAATRPAADEAPPELDRAAPSIAVDTADDTATEPDARWRVTGALDSTPFKKTTFIATSELTRAA